MSRDHQLVSSRGIILWLLFGLNVLVLLAAIITGSYLVGAFSIIVSVGLIALERRLSARILNASFGPGISANFETTHRNTSLAAELRQAVDAKKDMLPAHCIFVNSNVTVLDLETQHATELTIVLPEEADLRHNKLSVLAPLGMALLGFRTGEEVSWNSPAGMKRFKILDVINRCDRLTGAA